MRGRCLYFKPEPLGASGTLIGEVIIGPLGLDALTSSFISFSLYQKAVVPIRTTTTMTSNMDRSNNFFSENTDLLAVKILIGIFCFFL